MIFYICFKIVFLLIKNNLLKLTSFHIIFFPQNKMEFTWIYMNILYMEINLQNSFKRGRIKRCSPDVHLISVFWKAVRQTYNLSNLFLRWKFSNSDEHSINTLCKTNNPCSIPGQSQIEKLAIINLEILTGLDERYP